MNVGAASAVVVALVGAAAVAGCGKKGPPLAPLLKIPRAPADFRAERRNDEVSLQFTVPVANTDGSKPANVSRVDIFRFTGPAAATDAQVVKYGTRVATVAVKAPRDPNATTEADEPEEQPEFEEEGIEQGAIVRLEDELGASAAEQAKLPKPKQRKVQDAEIDERPSLGPPGRTASTTYVAVGFNKGGRRGQFSKRIAIPLLPPPMPPSTPSITYDESTVTVSWASEAPVARIQEPATGDVLPARFIGFPVPSIAFNVYDASPPTELEQEGEANGGTNAATTALSGELPEPVRLTTAPVFITSYRDSRIEWGRTRCYTVRTVEIVEGLTIESDASPPQCTMLKDTFPPAAPKGLRTVATERAISLIWEPNRETDLAGYLILRGVWPGQTLDRITRMPISDTSFTDTVPAGRRYVYAVQAIDKAGNVGALSNTAEETAR